MHLLWGQIFAATRVVPHPLNPVNLIPTFRPRLSRQLADHQSVSEQRRG